MNKSFGKILLIILLISVIVIEAQSRKFGLGVIIGDPTGISAKLWTSSNNAFALGLGWSIDEYRFKGKDYGNSTRLHIHMDYLWHSFNAINANGQFPLFYGIGGRINTGPQYSGTLGVRGVVGIKWLPKDVPLDIFVEVAPTLYLISSTGVGIDAGIGARYYF